jgi:hypothetical protein
VLAAPRIRRASVATHRSEFQLGCRRVRPVDKCHQLVNAWNTQQTTPFLTHIYSVENSSVFSDWGASPFCAPGLHQQTNDFGRSH